uniref:COX assembly mitochondrial protein n=1 Tax=Caenorhabditis tropicalis TaxID=1561998 RepID=A0A1I7U644_9PELO
MHKQHFSGACEALLCPLERVQALLQTSKYHDKFKNTLHALTRIQDYGYREYYRGFSVILIRNSLSSVQRPFISSEGAPKKIEKEPGESDGEKDDNSRKVEEDSDQSGNDSSNFEASDEEEEDLSVNMEDDGDDDDALIGELQEVGEDENVLIQEDSRDGLLNNHTEEIRDLQRRVTALEAAILPQNQLQNQLFAAAVAQLAEVEALIKKSGCWDIHQKVSDCMGEHRDWRKCQDVVKEFRTCIQSVQVGEPPKEDK